MPATFQHLVVLMMENRSFDHMLGFLKSPAYAIDGLDGTESNPGVNAGDPSVVVSRDARVVGDLASDPGHGFDNANVQIFGNTSGVRNGPTMRGFVKDFGGPNVMKCFTEQTLPVLSTLAKQYAVCDRWFSSVPGSTIPNRLFAHGATSLGSLTQDTVVAPAGLRTIFQVMDDRRNPANFRIYSEGATVLLANLYLARRQSHFHEYRDFKTDVQNGDLAEYTFIEPSYDDDPQNGKFATSQHPDFPVDEGEMLIKEIYTTISNSPFWESTLLLIVYDEHGGVYDHVEPPTLTPNPALGIVQPAVAPAFAFDRLGIRVPAVFVSPFISPGTIISRQFDHCSIVATVRKMFCLDKTPFNWREAQAATFDDVLDLDVGRARAPVAVPDPVTAPRTPPQGRKPTALAMEMALAMQHSLDQMGIDTPKRANQITTAQEATDYLRSATAALKARP
jgi:phospholipase C